MVRCLEVALYGTQKTHSNAHLSGVVFASAILSVKLMNVYQLRLVFADICSLMTQLDRSLRLGSLWERAEVARVESGEYRRTGRLVADR